MRFLDFGILDLVDITIVALLFYRLYKLVKGSVAVKIFIGITLIVLFWKIVGFLHLELLSNILGDFFNVGIIAVIIVFQQEIRKFLLVIGTTNISKKNQSFWKQFKWEEDINTSISEQIDILVSVVDSFSNSRTGSLMVIQRNTSLDFVSETGDVADIKISKSILESIFYKNSPLHDGAVILKEGRIVSTRAILPISNGYIPPRFGLRHRAAVGITEKTDAVCIVVSEETGELNYVKEGKIFEKNDVEDLIHYLKKDLN